MQLIAADQICLWLEAYPAATKFLSILNMSSQSHVQIEPKLKGKLLQLPIAHVLLYFEYDPLQVLLELSRLLHSVSDACEHM